MQPFAGTESLHDRNLRLAYYTEQNRRHRAVAHTASGHVWRRALGRSLIGLGSRLTPGPD